MSMLCLLLLRCGGGGGGGGGHVEQFQIVVGKRLLYGG
jgi:hypothetical protein